MHKINLTLPDGEKLAVPQGTSLLEIAQKVPVDPGFKILAAKVDNRLCSLDVIPTRDACIEFLTYASKSGKDIYMRTVNFILYMAVKELFANTRIVIGHSLGSGIYFDFFLDIPVNQEVLDTIGRKMEEIIAKDLPFKRKLLAREEAIDYFRDKAMSDNVRLLENSDLPQVTVYENGRFASLGVYPLAHSTGCVSTFALKTYSPGFVMLFPEQDDFQLKKDMGRNPKLFHIYQESKDWGRILGVNNVGRLNQVINHEGISDLIKISESLHEKKIAQIADAITVRKETIKMVLVAGPSAAGKTTFAKRLAIQLKVNGIRPINISVDNYFVDRQDCPRDESGEYDFEALEAIDFVLFNRHMAELLQGKEVAIPKYDFETGKRIPAHRLLRLEDDQLLIVEGIHCLTERLTQAIPAEKKFKIFVSALTQLSIDDHNRISTTDTRILRRMIRDKKFRNYQPQETLKRFASVIRGERTHIFPLQESADFVFNSALAYELSVIKDYALPLLRAIPETDGAYTEAQRLITFLELFCPVPPAEIPPTSILREYIGGSSFDY